MCQMEWVSSLYQEAGARQRKSVMQLPNLAEPCLLRFSGQFLLLPVFECVHPFPMLFIISSAHNVYVVLVNALIILFPNLLAISELSWTL